MDKWFEETIDIKTATLSSVRIMGEVFLKF